MLLKLSEQEEILNFNKVASALIRENNLPISSQEDFGRLFPDQISPANSYFDFFNRMKPLKNQSVFITTILNHPKNEPICVFGDYDKIKTLVS